jgi:hypothetical protein
MLTSGWGAVPSAGAVAHARKIWCSASSPWSARRAAQSDSNSACTASSKTLVICMHRDDALVVADVRGAVVFVEFLSIECTIGVGAIDEVIDHLVEIVVLEVLCLEQQDRHEVRELITRTGMRCRRGEPIDLVDANVAGQQRVGTAANSVHQVGTAANSVRLRTRTVQRACEVGPDRSIPTVTERSTDRHHGQTASPAAPGTYLPGTIPLQTGPPPGVSEALAVRALQGRMQPETADRHPSSSTFWPRIHRPLRAMRWHRIFQEIWPATAGGSPGQARRLDSTSLRSRWLRMYWFSALLGGT